MEINSVKIDSQYSISNDSFIIKLSEGNSKTINCSTLSNIRLLANLSEIKTVKNYFSNFFNTLNFSGSLNYSKLIGQKKSQEYIEYLKSNINETLPMVTNYHTEIFPKRVSCYKNLYSVMLDGKILSTPKYSHAGTTGRTSIYSGYNFLTMKKEKRSKLNAVSNNLDLYEVDFKSCEPFFFLKAQGKNIDEIDVYEWLRKNYDIQIDDRNKIKTGILSIIYGANVKTTARIMKLKNKKVLEIKDNMGVTSLNKRLREEYDKNGFILNYYGRPITSDNNLVNYWIQSSTVDFCSLAFLDFYNQYNISPCFFIHDSMTFQANKNEKAFLNVKTLKDKISGIEIPVEFNKITK